MGFFKNIKSIAVTMTTVSLLCLTSCANPSYKVNHVYGERGARKGQNSQGQNAQGQNSQGQNSSGKSYQGGNYQGQSNSRSTPQENQRARSGSSFPNNASSSHNNSGVSILASGGKASSSSGDSAPHEIFVPVPSSSQGAEHSQAARAQAKPDNAHTPSPSTPVVLSPPSHSESVAPRKTPGSYMVKPGDTLYSISKRFDVPIRDMIDKNNLKPPYQIKLGQTLLLPVAKTHKVVRHDTVYSIAHHYGVSLSEFIDVNHIKPPYQIKVGQTLVIPGKVVDYKSQANSKEKAKSTHHASDHASSGHASNHKIESALSSHPHKKEKPHREKNTPKVNSTKERHPRPIVERLPARSSSHFLWPVRGRIVSRFGQKKQGVRNNGISIAAPRGTPIRAAANGIVVYSGDKIKGFGKLILIKHSGGYITAYSHAQKSIVHRGQVVRRGQVIGTVGQTGSVNYPQLNFQIRRGRSILNPRHYLK